MIALFLCKVRKILSTIALLLFTASAAAGAGAASVLERQIELDGQGCSDIQWTVDLDNLKLLLSWKSVVGAEWTAFGVTDFGSMRGADMAVVRFRTGSSFEIEDRYSRNASMPQLDVFQNLELLSADYDEDDRMHVVIRRDLDTCDSHDLKITAHKQYIILLPAPCAIAKIRSPTTVRIALLE